MNEPRRPPATRLAEVLVLLIGAGAFWWILQPKGTFDPPPSRVGAPVVSPVQRAPSPVDVPRPRLEETGPTPRLFSEGFCGPNDDEGTITLRFSLRGQLRAELDRRLALLAETGQRATLNAVSDFLDSRQVPDGVSSNDVLIAAALRPTPPTRLLDLADRQAGREPRDPYLQIVRALAANQLDRGDVELDALRQARVALPRDPAVGWNASRLLRNTPAVAEAIADLDAYLAMDPVPALTRLRARLIVQRDIQRDYKRRTRDGVTVLWPADLLTDVQVDATLQAILDALDGVARLIGLARRASLTAVVYPGRSELFAVTCVPTWAGAVYDGTLRLVAAPEQAAGVGLEQLRHESTHAQLTPALPAAPHWFQEGLAQFFAQTEGHSPAAWALMLRNRTWIPFDSLDGSFHIFDKSPDADLAYAESLALVALMDSRGGSGALARAVRAFREGATTSVVLARATGQREVTGQDLLSFLAEKVPAAR